MFSTTNVIAKIILVAFVLALIPAVIMIVKLHNQGVHASSALKLNLVQYCTYLVVISSIVSIVLSLCYSTGTLLVSLILIFGAILLFILIIIWSKKFNIEEIIEQNEKLKG